MAGDVTIADCEPKPCCAALLKKLSKTESKLSKSEGFKAAFKEGISLLEKKVNELVAQNLNLTEECELERRRAELEREAKEEESVLKLELEKEANALKSENAILVERGYSQDKDAEGHHLLQTRVLEGEAEIKKLKEIIAKEKKGVALERQNAEAEKKKAEEARKLVKVERSKAEQEKKLAEIERKRADECKLSMEAAKLEACEAKEKWMSEKSKVEEASKKFEAERQRANKEKKCADSEKAKAEEQRKLADIERQKAVDEKVHADDLSKQLEEERLQKEALQKELQEIIDRGCSCSRGKISGFLLSDNKFETAEKNLLNKQDLKLGKVQVRHAKKIAKLEKVKNNLLKQELDFLKQDAMQFSHRLSVLDDCVTNGMEGIDSLVKIGELSNKQRFNSISRIAATNAVQHFKQAGESIKTLLPTCGMSCIEPISGTTSELESLIGGSIRSKSQNSAACSTSTSFSDGQLMGSQERVASINSSTRFTEESSKQRPQFSGLSGKGTKKRKSEIVGEVAEINNRIYSNLRQFATSELLDIASDHRRKRKRIQETGQSGASLHSEDDFFRKMEEMISSLSDISDLKNMLVALICLKHGENSKLLGNRLLSISNPLADLRVHKRKSSKRKKSAQKQKHVRPCDWNDEQQKIYPPEMKSNGDMSSCNGTSLTAACCIGKSVHQCGDLTTDAGNYDMAFQVWFEGMLDGNVMKLLELDDHGEEERFGIAMRRPLSPLPPTLCEIDFQELEERQVDDFEYMVEGGYSRERTNGEANSFSSHSFDVIDVEIDSNSHHFICGKEHTTTVLEPGSAKRLLHGSMDRSECSSSPLELNSYLPISVQDFQEVPSLSHGVCSLSVEAIPTSVEHRDTIHENGPSKVHFGIVGMKSSDAFVSRSQNGGSFLLECSKLLSDKNSNDNILTEAWRSNADNVAESISVKKPANFTNSEPERMDTGCFDDEFMQGSVMRHCVVYSNMKDEDSISRVICSIESCSSSNSMIRWKDWRVAEVLVVLAEQQNLNLEEKACVFFSLLLHNISVMASAKSGSDEPGDCLSYSDSLTSEIKKVGRIGLFSELCKHNTLFTLIEDFLISRNVLSYTDVLGGLLLPSDAHGRSLILGGRNISISSISALSIQLEAGGVVLASIGVATDRLSFVSGVSYNILRMCQDDLYWIIKILHIFAAVCGKKYFEQSNCRFIMAAVKSLVLLFEGVEDGVGILSSNCMTSGSEHQHRFPPCMQCPFAENAVCINQVLTDLLDGLKECAISAIGFQYMQQSVTSIHSGQPHGERIERILDDVNAVDGQIALSDASGCLSKDNGGVATETDFVAGGASHRFCDIVSSLELISCYMGWSWMLDNIIPCLVKLLTSHVSEEVLAAILILLGHVGGHGVLAEGYDQEGIEDLRCNLSAFLDLKTAQERSISSQFAAAKALTDLLPLQIEELTREYTELSVKTSHSGHTRIIREWFSHLNKDDQLSFLRLFPFTLA